LPENRVGRLHIKGKAVSPGYYKNPQVNRLAEVIKKIQALLAKQLGVKADYLLPVKKEDMPKTAIGKLQRARLRKRFEAGGFKDILKRVDILLENANTLPDWFYRKIWRRKLPLTLAPERREVPTLVFIDSTGLGDFLCGKLENCVKAEAGAAFARLSAGHYRIDPNESGDYRRLLKSLAADGIDISWILHLWTYGGDAEESAGPEGYAKGVYSLLFLAQALAEDEKDVHLFTVSSNTQPVLEDDVPVYEKIPLLGLLKSIPSEMPRLACRHLDFRLDGSPDQTATHGMQILREFRILRGEAEIAYRG
ncbi:MAG: hypothetical protein GY862_11045, partial [Gammaproteobacteria bacterium]|nr:hypothetical protein [Gammaproteobacteria bacterium]